MTCMWILMCWCAAKDFRIRGEVIQVLRPPAWPPSSQYILHTCNVIKDKYLTQASFMFPTQSRIIYYNKSQFGHSSLKVFNKQICENIMMNCGRLWKKTQARGEYLFLTSFTYGQNYSRIKYLPPSLCFPLSTSTNQYVLFLTYIC